MGTAISIEGLSKRFGGFEALAPLDLDVDVGGVLGYLGPNGAGKTVTIRLLLGLLRPSAGRAEIFGLDTHRDTIAAHRHLSYVAGEANLWPGLTGAETLHLLGRVQGRIDARYRDELIERFAFDPSKKVRSYSKGNRQKLGLIAALMSRADLLILDEPTSGLDPLMEREFRRCVLAAKAAGETVFLSSHILSEVEALCDRVAILRRGTSSRSAPSPTCATCRPCPSRPPSPPRHPICPASLGSATSRSTATRSASACTVPSRPCWNDSPPSA